MLEKLSARKELQSGAKGEFSALKTKQDLTKHLNVTSWEHSNTLFLLKIQTSQFSVNVTLKKNFLHVLLSMKSFHTG